MELGFSVLCHARVIISWTCTCLLNTAHASYRPIMPSVPFSTLSKQLPRHCINIKRIYTTPGILFQPQTQAACP